MHIEPTIADYCTNGAPYLTHLHLRMSGVPNNTNNKNREKYAKSGKTQSMQYYTLHNWTDSNLPSV